MLKRLILSAIILEIFTACGSGGGSSSSVTPQQQMNAKQGIIIFSHYPEDVCRSNEFYKLMQESDGFKNVLVQVETANPACSNYNKAYPNCVEVDAEQATALSCIVGFDNDSTNNLNNKISDTIPANEMDMLIDSAIIVAN